MNYLKDFEGRKDLINTYGNNALLLYVLELRFEISDIIAIAGEALTDGRDDKKCDLIYIDSDNGIAVIAQGYMRQNVDKHYLAPENKASDLNTASAWVFSQNPDTVPKRIQNQVRELQRVIREDLVNTIYFWYVHNLNERNNPKVKEELAAMQVTSNIAVKSFFPENKVDVFAIEVGNETIEKWFNASCRQITITDTLMVETVKKGFELFGDKWKAYVTAVKANWVQEQYNKYKDDIFSRNPRTYLGSGKKKNKINLGIIDTIKEQPNNFWAYNNGITALVNDYEVEENLENDEENLTISGITIINGAQTTGAVSSVDGLEEAWIPIRFIVCEDSTIIDNIINNNNKQNEIIASDLRSNDKVQNRLRKEFENYQNLYYSGGRRGNGRPSRSKVVLDPYLVAQAILAYHRDCVTAYNSRTDLWSSDRLYSSIFPDQLTAEHIIYTYSLARAIDEYRYELKLKDDERTEVEEQQYKYLGKRGSKMLFIYATSKCMESFLGGKIRNIWSLKFNDNSDFDKNVDYWKEIIRVIMPIAANTLENVLKDGLKSKELADHAVITVSGLITGIQVTLQNQFSDIRDIISFT